MLTVILATCNGARTLPKVLSAYCQLIVPTGGWSLVIVDDGSDDNTAAIIAEYGSRLPLRYLHKTRAGKNAALNLALDHVLSDQRTELLVFTDDDATPKPDWLVRFAECAAAQPDYAIFGGRIVPDWGDTPPEWVLRLVPMGITYAVTSAPDGPAEPRMVWGANMAVRRAVFDAGHRFNAAVGPAAGAYPMGSETEFNGRVVAAGFRAWFCNGAEIGHFIRPHQLTADYALGRAYRFGRGTRAQEPHSNVPHLFDIPRWMLLKFAKELCSAAGAWLRRDTDALFRGRWELEYLRGYFHEARRSARAQRLSPNI